MTHQVKSPHAAMTPPAPPRVRRPLTTMLVPAVALTVTAQAVSLLNGWDVMPSKILELLLLLGGATLVTVRAGGRAAVRRLYAGLTRGRIGVPRAVMVVAALPLLTVGVAAISGTLVQPTGGTLHVVLLYLLFLVFGALTGNLWEETAWGGFVQMPLMARHGLLRGSLITAVPFFLIHLPLAFEEKGWPGTSWNDALITWALLLISAPFFRYLIGALLIDTGGSVLAAGFLHASFNASGALAVATGGWQYIPAMIALSTAVALLRWRQVRATDQTDAVASGQVTG